MTKTQLSTIYYCNINDNNGQSGGNNEEEETDFSVATFRFSSITPAPHSNLWDCLLLDNPSTAHTFWNPKFTTKIYNTSDSMTLCTNRGAITTTTRCHIPKFEQEVWFHKSYITNVLSLIFMIEYTPPLGDGSKRWGLDFTVERTIAGVWNYMKYKVLTENGVSKENKHPDKSKTRWGIIQGRDTIEKVFEKESSGISVKSPARDTQVSK